MTENVFKAVLANEFKRVLNRQNLKILGGVLVLLVLLVVDGVSKYGSIKSDITEFQESEKKKIESYTRMSQYGGYGIRLMFIPSNFCVISNDAVNVPLSNINSGERLTIFKPLKGKNFFERHGYLDFGWVILIIGALFSLVMGYRTTSSRDYLAFVATASSPGRSFFSHVASRLLLLILVSLALLLLPLVLPLIKGINLFNWFLFYFALVFLLAIAFFFAVGVLVGLTKKRKGAVFLAFLYFLFALVIPWMLDKYGQVHTSDIQSLFRFEQETGQLIMEAENRMTSKFGTFKQGMPLTREIETALNDTLKREYKEIFDAEESRKNEILGKIKDYQILSALFPTSFYQSVKSVNAGGLNFINFYSYCQEKKFEFTRFYFNKRFYRQKETSGIEPFIKGDENIFYARDQLPAGFGIGVVFTLLYILVLFLAGYRRHGKLFASAGTEVFDFQGPVSGKALFVLCRNLHVKERMVSYFRDQGAACLRKITAEDFLFDGLEPAVILDHLCRVAGVSPGNAIRLLAVMGIGDISGILPSHKTVMKIYAAVKTAADTQLVVLDDFLKGESKHLEVQVFQLMELLLQQGKKVVYLSCEMYQTANRLDENIRVDSYEVFSLDDINGVTLR